MLPITDRIARDLQVLPTQVSTAVTLFDRLDTLPIDAVAAALAALPARVGASGSGKGLRPLIVALRARGGAWA